MCVGSVVCMCTAVNPLLLCESGVVICFFCRFMHVWGFWVLRLCYAILLPFSCVLPVFYSAGLGFLKVIEFSWLGEKDCAWNFGLGWKNEQKRVRDM